MQDINFQLKQSLPYGGIIRKYEEKFGEIVVKSDGKAPKFNLPEDVLPN